MIRYYPKGQILLFQGDNVPHLFSLIHGAVKVYTISDLGQENVLTIRSAPDIFPLSLVIGRPKSEFFYETLSDSQIEFLKPTDYEASELLTQAVKLYYEALHRIADLESQASERALAAVKYLKAHGIDKPTHQLVANLSGVTRETVSTKLKQHRTGGKNG